MYKINFDMTLETVLSIKTTNVNYLLSSGEKSHKLDMMNLRGKPNYVIKQEKWFVEKQVRIS